MLIRAARLSDIDQMMNLSTMMGEGMTSMPHDLSSWEKKLQATEASFSGEVEQRGNEIFQLVLVDEHNGQVMGTCAIFAAVGMSHTFYSYKVSRNIMRSAELGITADTRVLHLVNDFTGMTELASLFLQQEYRGNKDYPEAGRFLSCCRYLMLYDFRDHFSEHVFAEIRGWIDENGISPFWNAIGQHFFDLPFTEADFMSAVNGTQFIADLMPKDPIHINLLSKEAQEVVAKPNQYSIPALKMLENEGFHHNNYIDIFDGGPTIQCKLDQIESVRLAKVCQVSSKQSESKNQQACLVSNRKLDNYRIVMAEASLDDDELYLTSDQLDQLCIDANAEVSRIPLRSKS